MDSRRSQILHVILSIVIGIVAFCIASFLLLYASVTLLGYLQIDFVLTSQLLVLFFLSSIAGLILATFVGVKYYGYLGKSQ